MYSLMTIKGIRYSPVITSDLSDLFYCWVRLPSSKPGIEEEFKACKPGEFWRISGEEKKYTEFTAVYVKPKGYIAISLRSKETFKYGVFELRAKLPRYINGPMFWFGFEAEDLFGGGCVHFMWSSSRGRLYAYTGGFISRVEMDITSITDNVDYTAQYHFFRIYYREGLALWYIDDCLRAMGILGSGDTRDSGVLYSVKPYIIGFTRDQPSIQLPILLDIDAGDVGASYEWEIHPWGLRVFEGDPRTLVTLDLHLENSDVKLRGLQVEAGSSVISAPFPGTLDSTQLTFLATGRGKLYIESYVGGDWYVHEEFSTELNKLHIIKIPEKSLLYRVTFEALEKTLIREARVYLK